MAGVLTLAAAWIARGKEISTATDALDFETVYREHFHFAWRSLRGLGVSEHAIDDAAQEVFIVVHRKLGDVTDPVGLKQWIFSIVRRVASDHRRSRSRKGISVEYSEGSIAANEQTPQTVAETNEILSLIEAFMNTLNDENRSIFVLSEIEQLPVSRVSEILEMNSNTIYSRLRGIKDDLAVFIARNHTGVKAGPK